MDSTEQTTTLTRHRVSVISILVARYRVVQSNAQMRIRHSRILTCKTTWNRQNYHELNTHSLSLCLSLSLPLSPLLSLSPLSAIRKVQLELRNYETPKIKLYNILGKHGSLEIKF